MVCTTPATLCSVSMRRLAVTIDVVDLDRVRRPWLRGGGRLRGARVARWRRPGPRPGRALAHERQRQHREQGLLHGLLTKVAVWWAVCCGARAAGVGRADWLQHEPASLLVLREQFMQGCRGGLPGRRRRGGQRAGEPVRIEGMHAARHRAQADARAGGRQRRRRATAARPARRRRSAAAPRPSAASPTCSRRSTRPARPWPSPRSCRWSGRTPSTQSARDGVDAAGEQQRGWRRRAAPPAGSSSAAGPRKPATKRVRGRS